MIYFLQCGHDGPIKIGFTTGSVVWRIRQLQHTSPHILNLIGAHEGGREDETILHKQFADRKHRGEWFNPCQEIFAHIESRGGLADYNRLERPDLKAALRSAERKKWPVEINEFFKSLRRKYPREIGMWQEGMRPIAPRISEQLQEVVSKAKQSEAAEL